MLLLLWLWSTMLELKGYADVATSADVGDAPEAGVYLVDNEAVAVDDVDVVASQCLASSKTLRIRDISIRTI